MAVAACEQRKLDGGGGLARALEAHQHHHARRATVAQTFRVAAEQLYELLLHSLHDLLWSSQPRSDLHTCEPRSHALDEFLDHLEVDVGLEERHPNLPEAGVDVLRAKNPATGDLLEGGSQTLAEGLEHLRSALDASHVSLQAGTLSLEGGDRPAPAPGFRKQSQAAFVFFQRTRRAAHDVVYGRPGRALVRCDFRKRPVASQV